MFAKIGGDLASEARRRVTTPDFPVSAHSVRVRISPYLHKRKREVPVGTLAVWLGLFIDVPRSLRLMCYRRRYLSALRRIRGDGPKGLRAVHPTLIWATLSPCCDPTGIRSWLRSMLPDLAARPLLTAQS